MATKAQQFKAEQIHANRKPKPKKVRPAKRVPTDDAGARHLSKHGSKKATVATEESKSGRASRKSTRTSANKGKNSSMLEYASRQKLAQASSRHGRRG